MKKINLLIVTGMSGAGKSGFGNDGDSSQTAGKIETSFSNRLR